MGLNAHQLCGGDILLLRGREAVRFERSIFFKKEHTQNVVADFASISSGKRKEEQ